MYLTVGNLRSRVRNSPSTHALHLLALPSIPPKRNESAAKFKEIEQEILDTILQKVLEKILCPLVSPNVSSKGVFIECADNNVRLCFPILTGWLANIMEKTKLMGLMQHACVSCEAPVKTYGHYPLRGIRPHPRDHELYKRRAVAFEGAKAQSQAKSKELFEKARFRHTPIALWNQPSFCPKSNVFKPDVLHTFYTGLMTSMISWVIDFLRKHSRLEAFDRAFVSTYPYQNYLRFRKKFSKIQQWLGKEGRMMTMILHVCLAKALLHPEEEVDDDATPCGSRVKNVNFHNVEFWGVYQCAGALADFILLSYYRTHTSLTSENPRHWGTLNWMEYYLKLMHDHKKYLAKQRASTTQKRKITQALIAARDNEDPDNDSNTSSDDVSTTPFPVYIPLY